MNKCIDIDIDYSTWAAGGIPTSLSGLPNNENFNLIEVLIHIGLVTSHPEEHGINLNSFWAFLRYVNCFETGIDFKLNEKWNDIDPHQKTILSDDFGMGFASYYLHKHMNIISIIDTGFFLKYLPSLSVLKKSKRGPSKTPDFILLDSSYNIHILECKGTQSSLDSLEKQILDGISQKGNLNDPSKIVSEKLVTGIFIPQYNSTSSSKFKIIDPEFSMDFSNVSKDEVIFRSFQGQLAKEIQIFGIRELGNHIANKKILSEIQLDKLVEELQLNHFDSNITKEFYQDGLKWSVDFDITVLKKYKRNQIANLQDLFSFLIKSQGQNQNKIIPITKGYENSVVFNGLFGLRLTVVNDRL
ncbi:hypothetical protein NST77_23415 [Niallia sp. FSL W8-0177]|uniref:hypothetical protein n=1 Tax=Niallia sp. FSL W8-0177 TaxID=2954522 RepID=UPI0030F98EC0